MDIETAIKILDADTHQETKAALREVIRLSKRKVPQALNYMGILHWNGRHIAQDQRRSIKYFERAAKRGYPNAHAALGWRYMGGKGVKANGNKARKHLEVAAKSGNSDAMINLAIVCRDGTAGADKDRKAAIRWFQEAANMGEKAAWAMLAQLKLPEDETAYLNDLKEGVRQLDPRALAIYANELIEAKRFSRDLDHAYDLLVKAIEDKDNYAIGRMQSLGASFYNGEFGQRDSKKSLLCHLTAASAGNVHSMHYASRLLYDGEGHNPDYAMAVSYARKAAEANIPGAMEILGLCYSLGRGVEQSDERARYWFEKGKHLGDKACADKLSNLELVISEKQLAVSPGASYDRPAANSHAGNCRVCGDRFDIWQGAEGGFCSLKCYSKFYDDSHSSGSALDIDLPAQDYSSGKCQWCADRYSQSGYEGGFCSIGCYLDWYRS